MKKGLLKAHSEVYPVFVLYFFINAELLAMVTLAKTRTSVCCSSSLAKPSSDSPKIHFPHRVYESLKFYLVMSLAKIHLGTF